MTAIGYDITSAVKRDPGGVARYAIELVAAAKQLLPRDRRLLLGFRSSRWRQRELAWAWRDERTRVRVYPEGCGLYAFGGADVYHGLGMHVPAGLWGMPKIATMHAVYQSSFERGDGARGSKTLRAVRRADLLILPSEFDRRRAIEALGLGDERAVAILHGVDHERFRQEADEVADARIRAEEGLRPERPYVVCAGGWGERKNYRRLAEAFAAAQAHRTHDLVLLGDPGKQDRAVVAGVEALGLGAALRRPGHVAPARVPALIRGAEVAAFPSLRESFGLPAVEAMACGTPLLFAATHALPEVVGEAGQPCDPFDVESIRSGLEILLSDAERRKQLRALGLARSSRFTWARCLRETLDCYERLCGKSFSMLASEMAGVPR